MEINVSKIVSDKLAELDESGAIKQKIEETLEKSVMDAVCSTVSSWEFKRAISDQVKSCVNDVAKDCGFSAYNGFIVQAVKSIITDKMSADIADKLEKSLNDIIIAKHENIKLSEIFDRYRKWLFDHVDESEKYANQNFCCELEEGSSSSYFSNYTHYTIKLGETSDDCDIEIRIFGEENKKAKISSLYLNGRNMDETLHIGMLTDFESFLANLYYNKTEILLDIDEVNTSDYYDIDI